MLAAFNGFWRLGRADWKLDETVYASAGWGIWHGDASQNPEHPPFAKELIGLGQLVFGRSAFGVRMVPALAFVGAVVVLFAFGRRVGGWWTGIVAAGLYAALPRTLEVAGHQVAAVRADRYGLLESIAGPLLVAGIFAGWRWITGGGWRWAAAAGGLLGLAGASKLTALVAVVPVVAVGAFLRWRRRDLALEVAVLVGVSAVAFVAPFLVHGTRTPHAIGQMIRLQRDHAALGQLLVLGGSVWSKSPWWANERYAWDADGPLLTAALLAGTGAAVVAARRLRPVVLYLVAVVISLVGALALSPVALPHYRVIWTGPLVLLVAIGTVDLVRRAAPAARAVGGLILVVLALVGAAATLRVATLPEGDGQRLAHEVQATGHRVSRIVYYSDSVGPYFPGSTNVLAFLDDGRQPAQLLVLDPSLAEALGPGTIATWRGWARRWGLVPHRVGSLEGWWAP